MPPSTVSTSTNRKNYASTANVSEPRADFDAIERQIQGWAPAYDDDANGGRPWPEGEDLGGMEQDNYPSDDEFERNSREAQALQIASQSNVRFSATGAVIMPPSQQKRVPVAEIPWAQRSVKRLEFWRDHVGPLVGSFSRAFVGLPTPFVIAPGSHTLTLLDLTGRTTTTYTPRKGIPSSLIAAGYLPATPHRPSIAFSAAMVKEYLGFRKFGFVPPYTGMQTYAHLHRTKFVPGESALLSSAITCYLFLSNALSERILSNVTIGEERRRDICCPLCETIVPGEKQLKYSALFAIDGNFSHKRFRTKQPAANTSFQPDQHRHDSDLFIDPENVDEWEKFINNIAAHPCTSNWKAANQQQANRAANELDETGLVSAVCRHGFVFGLCDMIQSGEKFKYAFALIDRLRYKFADVGASLLIGYDIGCTFSKTYNRVVNKATAPLPTPASLDPRSAATAQPAEVNFCCGVWHGYSHNRTCQLDFHPRYLIGAGLEDFEGCERLWANLNRAAASTRRATKYHRGETLDFHVRHWNAEQRAGLALWLCRRWKTAVTARYDLEALIKDQCYDELGPWDARIARGRELIEAERIFIENQPATVQPSLLEVELEVQKERLLDILEREEERRNVVDSDLNRHNRFFDLQKLQRAKEAIFERFPQLGPEFFHWYLGSADVQAIAARRNSNRLTKALHTLERLLILEEMEKRKLGHRQNYQERSHLPPKRQKEIAAALKKYNELAQDENPPAREISAAEAPQLTRDGVLRDALLREPWLERSARELANAVAKLDRVEEEEDRLRVEYVRMSHWFDSEFEFWTKVEAETVADTWLNLATITEAENRLHQLEQLRSDLVSCPIAASLPIQPSAPRADGIQRPRTSLNLVAPVEEPSSLGTQTNEDDDDMELGWARDDADAHDDEVVENMRQEQEPDLQLLADLARLDLQAINS